MFAFSVCLVDAGGDGLRGSHVAGCNRRGSNRHHPQCRWNWGIRPCPQGCEGIVAVVLAKVGLAKVGFDRRSPFLGPPSGTRVGAPLDPHAECGLCFFFCASLVEPMTRESSCQMGGELPTTTEILLHNPRQGVSVRLTTDQLMSCLSKKRVAAVGHRLRCCDKPFPAKGRPLSGTVVRCILVVCPLGSPRWARPARRPSCLVGPCVFQARGLIAVGQRFASVSKARNNLKEEALVIFFLGGGLFGRHTSCGTGETPVSMMWMRDVCEEHQLRFVKGHQKHGPAKPVWWMPRRAHCHVGSGAPGAPQSSDLLAKPCLARTTFGGA